MSRLHIILIREVNLRMILNSVEVKDLYSKLPFLFLMGILLSAVSCSCSKNSDDTKETSVKPIEYRISIPMGGNSWVVNNHDENQNIIGDEGIINWSNSENEIRTWFRVEQPGEINIGVRAKLSSGKSKLNFLFGEENKEIELTESGFKSVDVGSFTISTPGYYSVSVRGLEKSGSNYGEISDLLLGGKAAEGTVYYVKDDFYWGRRGPSVHLAYKVPENVGNVEWFYNEITVPKGNDVIGSYFMANGFGEGYFGMQVNSSTERRILFSVWSPYQTDDPSSIPDDQKIKLLKKGADVNTGSFGNEGSGGQSYKIYNWKSEYTYRFLLKGHPTEDNSTDYTAYFFVPEKGEWELIASFRRPKISTYLTRPHSFLENFITEMGPISREAFYSNQWVVNTEGKWYELSEAKFTADATARKDARLDYAGGTKDGKFYLKNCGFFNERVVFDTNHTREKTGEAPVIDFGKLP